MSATAVKIKTKTNIYENRKNLNHAIADPVDSDSDSDFNSGVFVPEKPKRTRKAKLPTAAPGLGKADAAPTGARRRRERAHRSALQSSPLFEYFGDALNLSASLSDGEPDQGAEAEDEDEEEEDVDPDQSAGESDGDMPAPSRPPPKKPSPPSPRMVDLNPSQEDSVTESDSEEHTPPMKRAKLAHCPEDGEDSKTESDSGAEPAAPANNRTQAEDDGSVTEPDSDAEMATSMAHEPRPAFVRTTTQPLLGPLVLDKAEQVAVPAPINTFLREYQRDGVRFFYEQYKAGRGALLGDDMGLVRKTIQVIAFLSAIMRKRGDARDTGRRHEHVSRLQDGAEWARARRLPPADKTWPTCLIVAPSTVVYNWERELETWGYFDVGMYVGPKKERQPVLDEFKLGRLDIVLTSFETALRDIDLLDALPWTVVIIDECHRMKNPRAKTTEAFARLTHPRCRVGLTGTAIQNSYEELWTILDWTNPGRVGSQGDWEAMVMGPLKVGQSKGASDEERARAHLVARALHDKLLPRFWRRRTKDIIKDQLPKKTDDVVFCPLTPKQIDVYKRILALPAVENMIRRDEPCDCGSKKERKKCCYPWVKGDLLRFIATMIKISNHLCLILPYHKDNHEQNQRNREWTNIAFPDEDTAPRYGTAMLQPDLCGKWLVLETLLQQWRKDRSNKILIFTKTVKLLDMLEFHLNNNGYGQVRLDGSVKQADRMGLIDKFHQDPDVIVFLISTLAGGTGLNLTGANKVVIFDPNWNPAHDLQAMDRAYRFGQTRDVAVYRLLGAGSIEELIYARQLYKQQQMKIGYEASIQTRYFEGVQGGEKGELFGLKNIFTLHEDTLATKMAIESAHVEQMDWTLAHKAADKRKAKSWVYEAEAANPEDDCAGLGAFLFDDDVRPAIHTGDEEVNNLLEAKGIKYSHQNDKMIVENPAEKERVEKTIKEQKRKRAEARHKPQAQEPGPVYEWPPKRKHHKPPPATEQRLAMRQLALFDLGYIRTPADHADFAQEFNRKSHTEQQEILARLDRHATENPE